VTSPEKLIDAYEVNPARLRAAVGRFTSVSLDPPLVLVSIAERAKMDGEGALAQIACSVSDSHDVGALKECRGVPS
jgi:flavin reductase (DIM6/NTAB) family NADH-FMN oxidoreductase RutF